MAEFNDTYKKAGILMQSALKKYEAGDIEGGDRDRQMANEMYDKAETQVDAAAMLYGENRNFGKIYKVFENNTSKLFKDKKQHGKLKKILKFIKENKTLKSEFDAYNTLIYPDSVTNAEQYVNEAISLIPNLDKNKVIENNQKFIDLIRELKLNETVDISDDDLKLFEAVEYVVLNPRTLYNVNEYVEAKKCITEHIEKNCNYTNLTNETVDEVYNSGMEKVDENYQKNLNEEEKMFVEKLAGIPTKEAYFDAAKLHTLKVLDTQLNECDDENREGLQKIIENISKKAYDENKFIADAAEFREIRNTLQEQTMSKALVQTLATELAKKYRGEPSRNEDWIIGEISYNTPDDVDTEKIIKDIKELSQRYNPEDVGYMVISNMMAGEYRGWWNENKEHGS